MLAAPLLLAGCSVVPGERPPRNLSGGTTLEVTLVVNGQAVATYGPGEGTSRNGFAGPLPPLPWTVVVRTSGGRVLASMTVNPGTWRRPPSRAARSSSGPAEIRACHARG